MDAEHDIIAGTGHSDATTSIGALAAYVAGSCGHVIIDPLLATRGYRFYAAIGDEIPHFFLLRGTAGDTPWSITLQGMLPLDGVDDPFDMCLRHSEALEALQSPDLPRIACQAKINWDTRLMDVSEVADPLFIAKQPAAFRTLADELVAIGVLPSASCPVCSE